MGGQFRENWKRLTNRLPAGNTSRDNSDLIRFTDESKLTTNASGIGGITFIGTPNLGDVIKFDGTNFIPSPDVSGLAPTVPTLATVLAEGNTTGGANISISDADSIAFVDGSIVSGAVLFPAGIAIQGDDAVLLNADGGQVFLFSGAGDGSGDGGQISLLAQDGGVTGAGGPILLTAGNGGGGNEDGGDISLTPGAAAGAGTKGAVVIATEARLNFTEGFITAESSLVSSDWALIGNDGAGSGPGKSVGIFGGVGATTGAGGFLNFAGGQGGPTDGTGGVAWFTSGPGGGTNGNSGGVYIDTGGVGGGGTAGVVDVGTIEASAVSLGKSGGDIGFLGATAISRPAVTGVAPDDAFSSLVSALSSLGLITDSTT